MIEYYPFELHTHTHHSDGSMSPQALVEYARLRGLKGIAITDHNTTSSVQETINSGKKLGIVVIPGIEWTLFFGHLTVLGGNSSVDWRDITRDNIKEYIDKATSEGDLVNIAHPKRVGSPLCTGCFTDYVLDDYSNVAGYEVWSNAKPQFKKTNQQAYEEYLDYCHKGIRLSCIYGDDWHDKRNNNKQYAITYLGIQGEVNVENALTAIKKRKTYISTGVVLDIEMNSNNKPFDIGDVISSGIMNIKGTVHLIEDYCKKFQIIPRSISVTGTAVEQGMDINIERKIQIDDCKVTKGYFIIMINGFINGERAPLLITSPIFVED